MARIIPVQKKNIGTTFCTWKIPKRNVQGNEVNTEIWFNRHEHFASIIVILVQMIDTQPIDVDIYILKCSMMNLLLKKL